MKQITEGDESKILEISFKDQYKNDFVPSSVNYTVYSITEDSTILASTALTPAAVIELQLTGDLVTLVDSTNSRERNRICVTAVDIDGNSLPRKYEYEVIADGETCA